jgi:hypothetical protein
MWSFNGSFQLPSSVSGHGIRSDSATYNRSVEEPHDRNRFHDTIGRNARVDALREELYHMALHDATTLPPAPNTFDMALPSSADSSRFYTAPQAPTIVHVASMGGIHAAALGSRQQRRLALHSISDERRFGIYLPSATASENNLVLRRAEPFTLHNLQERAASLPPASLAAASTLQQRVWSRPRTSPHLFDNATDDDPPPEYVAFDPYPFFSSQPKPRRRSTLQLIETVYKDGIKATTGKVGKSVVKHVEDVGKMAKDVPHAFKEAQVKLSSRRARGKIRWLEKRNYLSGQERLLTQALLG